MSGWHTPVDIYCERVDPSFWAEPLNAVSNGAFVIAALIVGWRITSRRPLDSPALFFAILIGVIGVGSFLFHTYATRWAGLADVLPIAIFIHGFLFLALRRFFGLGIIVSSLIIVGFFLLSGAFAAALPDGFLNGSGSYLPALAALLMIGFLLRLRAGHAERWLASPKTRVYETAANDADVRDARIVRPRETARLLLVAGVVFVASLAFRSIDMAVCDVLPIGVHYIWHVLNAIVLALAVEAARPMGPAHLTSTR